jgi:hypothetical protein
MKFLFLLFVGVMLCSCVTLNGKPVADLGSAKQLELVIGEDGRLKVVNPEVQLIEGIIKAY